LSGAGICRAERPQVTIEKYIDQVYELLSSDKTHEMTLQNKELRQKLIKIADEIFDFNIMARMSLAVYWKAFDEQQHHEFVDLFTKLLETTYFAKIEQYLIEIENFNRQDITITEEVLLSSKKAEVRSMIRYQNEYIPVDYRLIRSSSGWKVYDVSVEGVSLVRNYRDQFRDFMMKHSPEELLEYLQEKINKQEKVL
jgi:phospholipid transport system substrate-binding protein